MARERFADTKRVKKLRDNLNISISVRNICSCCGNQGLKILDKTIEDNEDVYFKFKCPQCKSVGYETFKLQYIQQFLEIDDILYDCNQTTHVEDFRKAKQRKEKKELRNGK